MVDNDEKAIAAVAGEIKRYLGVRFRAIKRQFDYTKVRYRGLAKNAAQVFALVALTNLYLARRRLMVSWGG